MTIGLQLRFFLALCLLSTAACSGGSGTGPMGGASGQANQLIADAGSSGWTNLGTNDAGAIAPNAASYGRLSVAGSVPYAIFSDSSKSGKLSLLKLSGGKWTAVGSAGFSTESTSTYTLSIDGTTPFVAYTGDTSSGLNVMKFNGSAWVTVGAANFATGNSYGAISLAVANGIVYVGFIDTNYQLHVMSYGGSSWVDVGGGPIATSVYTYCTMGLFNGAVYVAYNDPNTSVMKLVTWSGTAWTVVATSTYTIDDYWDPVLTVSNNTLYLIYSTSVYNTTSGKPCGPIVWKLSGTALVSVGALCSISNGDYVEYVSGTVYNGLPYVAFDDEDRDSDLEPRAAVVKYFDGAAWQLYAGYPSPNDIENTFIFADPDSGKLYLTYEDWSNEGMIVQVH